MDDLQSWHAVLVTLASSGNGKDSSSASAHSAQAPAAADADADAAAGRADGAHDLKHLHRVWANARALMATPASAAQAAADPACADPLVVMAACYLHDLVNLPKQHPERAQASRLSAARARTLLAHAGFPADRLDAVAHAIEAHSFSAALAPRTLEACLVQDADRLDALGAIGLARLFYIAGQMGSALADDADPLARARPLDDRRFALDHIVVKLARLPAMMHTAAGRALATERLAGLLAFRHAFADEWGDAAAAHRCADVRADGGTDGGAGADATAAAPGRD